MSGITLRTAIPTNFKVEYKEFDNVDFVLAYENSSLVLGSVRVEGVVAISNNSLPLYDTTNTPSNLDRDIGVDSFVGAHAFFEGITTETNQGVIENLVNLPRYEKMMTTGSQMTSDMFNFSNQCELKTPSREIGRSAIRGIVPFVQMGTPRHIDPDFSIKPNIALNSADGMLPYRRTGDIRIALNLARVASALSGLEITSTTDYSLRDLRITYRTYPDDGSNNPITLDSKLSIVQSIQSSFANLDIKVPAVVNSVSCSFNNQSEVNSLVHNNTALVKIPQLSQVIFQFNDSTNKLISYVLRDNQEVVARYIDSFQDTGKNQLSRNNMENNDGFGIGLNLNGDIDMTNQKFGVQIQSGITNNNPMTMYAYFHSSIQI